MGGQQQQQQHADKLAETQMALLRNNEPVVPPVEECNYTAQDDYDMILEKMEGSHLLRLRQYIGFGMCPGLLLRLRHLPATTPALPRPVHVRSRSFTFTFVHVHVRSRSRSRSFALTFVHVHVRSRSFTFTFGPRLSRTPRCPFVAMVA